MMTESIFIEEVVLVVLGFADISFMKIKAKINMISFIIMLLHLESLVF